MARSLAMLLALKGISGYEVAPIDRTSHCTLPASRSMTNLGNPLFSTRGNYMEGFRGSSSNQMQGRSHSKELKDLQPDGAEMADPE